MRYAQLVIGPAGCGKSTYCHTIQQHCESVGRTMHVVNLDPAAEAFDYSVAFDVRELVALEDVMEELHYGPNGALVYCMEYLEENMEGWLKDELDDFIDDDYIIFDCPGQIELFSHVPVLRTIVDKLKNWDFYICAVYILDAQFVTDVSKFVSGCLSSLSAMVQLELPHVNVLSKIDLVPKSERKALDKYLDPEVQMLLGELNQRMPKRYAQLNNAMAELVDEYSLVNFVPLDITDEHSIEYLLSMVDQAIQFGEDADVKIKDPPPEDD